LIRGNKILAVIPARGGSKGLPGKNVRLLGGKPLIAWSIDAALASSCVDRCIVSTDDAAISEAAQLWGGDVPFLRPPELATDDARIEDALIDVLDRVDERYDYIVLLQPTSPLRSAADIDGCVQLCVERQAPACITLSPPSKSPYLMYLFDGAARLQPFADNKGAFRRQDLPEVFALNGAVYVAEVDWFRERRTFMSAETVGYVMPSERSADIDTFLDFRFAEFLISEKAS
jgi:CMP-N-acetylneuraminic acid synthetase